MSNVTVSATAVAHAEALPGYRLATAREVRNWANVNGYTLGHGRGRMPMAAVKGFNEAHEGDKVQYVLGTGTASAGKSTPRKYEYTTKGGRKGKTIATTPARIREWAADNFDGEVPARGRLPRSVVDAFGQAHAKTRKPRKDDA